MTRHSEKRAKTLFSYDVSRTIVRCVTRYSGGTLHINVWHVTREILFACLLSDVSHMSVQGACTSLAPPFSKSVLSFRFIVHKAHSPHHLVGVSPGGRLSASQCAKVTNGGAPGDTSCVLCDTSLTKRTKQYSAQSGVTRHSGNDRSNIPE